MTRLGENKRISAKGLAISAFFLLTSQGFALEAPGKPGLPHQWAPASKDAIGTSFEFSGSRSPVWFTLADGILSEVFFPTVDTPQIGDLQLLVTDGASVFAEQKRDVRSSVRYIGPTAGTVEVRGEERRGLFKLTQRIVTDPRGPVVRIQTVFTEAKKDLRVFVLFKPALHGGGSGDRAATTGDSLLAEDRGFAVSLRSSLPFLSASAGYVGVSDGWQDVSKNFRLTKLYDRAGPGNIALIAELGTVMRGSPGTFDLALGFGTSVKDADANSAGSLRSPFEEVRSSYDAGWNSYARSLKPAPRDLRTVRSAFLIKMHEDKRNRGAIVASLSTPGIPGGANAPEENKGGYHLVWPRDLYHAALGLLAAGDSKTPVDVLDYLMKRQLPDGSWAQNFWVDGSPYWGQKQLDETAFPIVLAGQLARMGVRKIGPRELAMIRKAASFLVKAGPLTPQDRWEENSGYSPNTLASVLLSLRIAGSALNEPAFTAKAAEWASNLERWTVVPKGPHGENYFLRISPSGNPSANERIELANGAGSAHAPEILDGGFLDLVRLGVRPANDPFILRTLSILDAPAHGMSELLGRAIGYRRYNRDRYGPAGRGGFWPLLAGERGHFAVAAGNLDQARAQLALLESSASEAGLIPEQVVRLPNGVGPGAPRPLAWAHAEQIRLRVSIERGRVFDGWMDRRR